jgi:hypothetical protein
LDGASSSEESATAGPSWPFLRLDPKPVEGWLRAVDDKRGASIKDLENGVYVFPSTTRKGGTVVFQAQTRICSAELCARNPHCVHAYEHDFRFGKFKGMNYVPPASRLVVGKERVRVRNRPRPNPMVDGRRYETVRRKAYEEMPSRCWEIAAEIVRFIRAEASRGVKRDGVRVGPGRPRVDVYDAAVMAALKFGEKYAWYDMKHQIGRFFDAGWIQESFDQARCSELMNYLAFAALLEYMCRLAERPFRKISKVLYVDGSVYSTKPTTNARKKEHLTTAYRDGSVAITLHALFDLRWGFMPAFRLTWWARGAGSGEGPHLPYLVKYAQEVFDIESLLADEAYDADENLLLADTYNFNLFVPIDRAVTKSGKRKRRSKFLDAARADEWVQRNLKTAPGLAMRIVSPFRQKGEGWNNVVRTITGRSTISRPDRSNIPQFKNERAKHPSAGDDLPEDYDEREAFIIKEQDVGLRVRCEFLCRRLTLALRALVLAEIYYDDRVSIAGDRAFRGRAEDESFSIFRVA